jgi:hypothetical protein
VTPKSDNVIEVLRHIPYVEWQEQQNFIFEGTLCMDYIGRDYQGPGPREGHWSLYGIAEGFVEISEDMIFLAACPSQELVLYFSTRDIEYVTDRAFAKVTKRVLVHPACRHKYHRLV